MESKNDSFDQVSYSDIELGDIIGGGGVGLIYKGKLRGKREAVALKTLFDSRVSDELRQEYLDELLVFSKVRHSNIVEFLGACMTAPHLFYVMELCECSLFDKIHKKKEDFSSTEAINMALDVSYAMEYLHSLNPCIIHRDLKSLNVLIARDGRLKLCDFGLVKVRNSQVGTPAYMAPDVYSFGVLLCEIFSHEIPFFMLDVNDVIDRVTSGGRPLISHSTPAPCVSLIKECWCENPKDRLSFTEVVDRLIDIQDNLRPVRKHSQVLSQGQSDTLDSLLGCK